MKEFGKFFMAQFFLVTVLLFLLFLIAGRYVEKKINTVDVNDYVETAKENWNHLDSAERFIGRPADTEIRIFDKDNRVVYSSSQTVFDGINSPLDAVRDHLLIFPVTDDGVFLGTLVLYDPSNQYDLHRRQKIWIIMFFSMLIMFLSYGIFFCYVNRSIIKPFRRMKQYASLIAQGKLDEPFIMDRNNMFGLFTESFDTMREELKSSKKRELALQLKEKELVASLSHDLKTPVTGIKLICELLEVKVKEEDVRGKIVRIHNKTEEINVLLNNLLSSALEDLHEMTMNCAEETSDILNRLLEEHDPHKMIVCEYVPDCIINVDRNRLSQVLGNIISNSYKYANTQIDVTYCFHGKYLEMCIRDYGDGVEQEELDLITNKFYRGKRNTAQKEGSGLGLYISKGLMEKMKGQLFCKSGEDGFCVVLRIPLA